MPISEAHQRACPVQKFSTMARPVRPNSFSVAVIIPALDEERSIGRVLDDIPRPPITEVIVVDNGRESAIGFMGSACALSEADRRLDGVGYARRFCARRIQDARHDRPVRGMSLDEQSLF